MTGSEREKGRTSTLQYRHGSNRFIAGGEPRPRKGLKETAPETRKGKGKGSQNSVKKKESVSHPT